MTHRTRSQRIWHGTRETALWIGAVLGSVGILLVVVHVALGITPMIVKSGSMEPEIMTGALTVTREVHAADVEVGDVVSVRDDGGDRITHRVVSTTAAGPDTYALQLQGDANDSPDPLPYTLTSADRVLFDVPYAGYVASYLLSPGVWLVAGSFLLAVYALSLAGQKAVEE